MWSRTQRGKKGRVLRRHHDILRGGRHYKQDCGSAMADSRVDEEKLKRLKTERVEDVQQAGPVKVYEMCWCSSLLVQGRYRLLKSASAVACGHRQLVKGTADNQRRRWMIQVPNNA
ncbi:hypothetical protein J3458_013318 [Metarhizium acridum]|uniref:uncharacterized protein n=1 Tax=Metarhizium acridum TaxID=92637 RepID=UPI001C6D0DA0|nr:hypothetical protein J3458_013318 [Metarhizium acridum]